MGGCASKDKKDAVIGDATTTEVQPTEAVVATTNGDATDGCVFFLFHEFVSWRKWFSGKIMLFSIIPTNPSNIIPLYLYAYARAIDPWASYSWLADD